MLVRPSCLKLDGDTCICAVEVIKGGGSGVVGEREPRVSSMATREKGSPITTAVTIPVRTLGGDLVAEIPLEENIRSRSSRSAGSTTTTTVRDVRLRLAKSLGVSACSLRLVHGTRVLSDDDRVPGDEEDSQQQPDHHHHHHLVLLRLPPLRCATASDASDGTVQIWCSGTGESLLTLSGHQRTVYSLAFSSDGSRLLSGSRDGTAKLWCVESGECLLTLTGHASTVAAVAFSPKGALHHALTGSHDFTAKIWCLQSGSCLLTLEGHGQAVTSVALSPDGSRGVTGCYDGTVKFWCTETGRSLHSYEAFGHQIVMAVAFSSPAAAPAAAILSFVRLNRITGAATVYRCDEHPASDGLCLPATATLREAQSSTYSIYLSQCAFSKDCRRVLLGNYSQGFARIWCARSGACLVHLKAKILEPCFESYVVAFSPDGDQVLIGTMAGATKLWSAIGEPNECLVLQQQAGGNGRVTSVAFGCSG